MTTSGPSRFPLSRVQVIVGLMLAIVLAGLPALHAMGVQAHRSCTLCVVLSAWEPLAQPAAAPVEPPPAPAVSLEAAEPATDAPSLVSSGRSPPALAL